MRDWVYTKLRDAITINANIRTKSCPKILLVFVSLVCYINFSIIYVHLKSHFFGKLNHEVYNWSIGWSAIIFLSLARLQASHNVGSHTAHIILFWDILFWTQSRVELPGKCFFLVSECSSNLPCVWQLLIIKYVVCTPSVHAHIPVRWRALLMHHVTS